jgi:hypothetical protein
MAEQPHGAGGRRDDFGMWIVVASLIGFGAIIFVAYLDFNLLAPLGSNPVEAFVAVVLLAVFVWMFQLILTIASERSRATQFRDISGEIQALTARVDALAVEIRGLRDDLRADKGD